VNVVKQPLERMRAAENEELRYHIDAAYIFP
jgi:hypothetical protein